LLYIAPSTIIITKDFNKTPITGIFNMAIYKTKVFERWASKEELDDKVFCKAVQEMTEGLFDADLGGGLFKKRIARPGKGKSGGYRTLVATNKGDQWFFVFSFPKNARGNINNVEEKALKMYTNQLLSYTQTVIDQLTNDGKLIRVECNEKSEIRNS